MLNSLKLTFSRTFVVGMKVDSLRFTEISPMLPSVFCDYYLVIDICWDLRFLSVTSPLIFFREAFILSISFWSSSLNLVSSSASYCWDCRFTFVLFARKPRSASVNADVSAASHSEIGGASTTSSISGLLVGCDYCFMTLFSLASSWCCVNYVG